MVRSPSPRTGFAPSDRARPRVEAGFDQVTGTGVQQRSAQRSELVGTDLRTGCPRASRRRSTASARLQFGQCRWFLPWPPCWWGSAPNSAGTRLATPSGARAAVHCNVLEQDAVPPFGQDWDSVAVLQKHCFRRVYSCDVLPSHEPRSGCRSRRPDLCRRFGAYVKDRHPHRPRL
jgi:hypothetical protein